MAGEAEWRTGCPSTAHKRVLALMDWMESPGTRWL